MLGPYYYINVGVGEKEIKFMHGKIADILNLLRFANLSMHNRCLASESLK